MPKKTKPKKYNRKVDEAYVTYTPQALIDLCKDCPYPLPICGKNGSKTQAFKIYRGMFC